MSSFDDRAEEAKGRVEKAAGDLTDDDDLRRKGTVDRVVRKGQEGGRAREGSCQGRGGRRGRQAAWRLSRASRTRIPVASRSRPGRADHHRGADRVRRRRVYGTVFRRPSERSRDGTGAVRNLSRANPRFRHDVLGAAAARGRVEPRRHARHRGRSVPEVWDARDPGPQLRTDGGRTRRCDRARPALRVGVIPGHAAGGQS